MWYVKLIFFFFCKGSGLGFYKIGISGCMQSCLQTGCYIHIISFTDAQEIFFFCQVHCLKLKCCLWSQVLGLHPVCSDFETAGRAPLRRWHHTDFVLLLKQTLQRVTQTFDISHLCRSLSDTGFLWQLQGLSRTEFFSRKSRGEFVSFSLLAS